MLRTPRVIQPAHSTYHPPFVACDAPGNESYHMPLQGRILLLLIPLSIVMASKLACPFYRWLFGEWQVTSTFTDFVAPLGESFVDRSLLVAAKASAEEGGIGSSSSFTQRWFSTLPNSFKNQVQATGC